LSESQNEDFEDSLGDVEMTGDYDTAVEVSDSEREESFLASDSQNDSISTGGDAVFKRPPPKSQNKNKKKKNVIQGGGGASSDTDTSTSLNKWAYSQWEKLIPYKYETVTVKSLFVFLNLLERDKTNKKYKDVDKYVVMVTKEPQELYDLLDEAINSFGGPKYPVVKKNMKMVLSQIKEFISLPSEGKDIIRENLQNDPNFLIFGKQFFQKALKLNDEQMGEFTPFFALK